MDSIRDEVSIAEKPGALGLPDRVEDDEEEEEWEYEYSTTETETYYLTIELSYPEFKDRQSRAIHHSRGGYYKHWLDQTPGQLKAPGEGENEGDNDNDDEPLPEPEADDDDPDIDPELQDKGKGVDRGEGDKNEKAQDDDLDQAEDIQIIDLHSKNPLISYKGRVFEGQWAEVIGTEAIFANRDSDNPLPALRQLDKNIDLLGASASRILTTEKVLKPKVPKEDPLVAIREEWNIRIPVGKDRTGERAQQTRFLENLMALKLKKGETDQVTVYAKDGEGKDFKDSQDPDYKPRRRRRILNEDGEEVIPKRERRRGGRRRTGRPRLGGSRGRGDTALMETTPASDIHAAATGPNTLSTPTPGRWEDLDEREEEEEEEEEEEDDDEDDDEPDEEMEDRSDSDEDEDMSMVN